MSTEVAMALCFTLAYVFIVAFLIAFFLVPLIRKKGTP